MTLIAHRLLVVSRVLFVASAAASVGGGDRRKAEEGWKFLFDGKSLDGWRTLDGKPAAGWEAKDGVLRSSRMP